MLLFWHQLDFYQFEQIFNYWIHSVRTNFKAQRYLLLCFSPNQSRQAFSRNYKWKSESLLRISCSTSCWCYHFGVLREGRCEVWDHSKEIRANREDTNVPPSRLKVRQTSVTWHDTKKGQSKWTNTANTSMQICIVWPTHTSNWIAPWCVDRNRPHGFTRPKIKSCHGFYTYSMMYMTTVQGHIPAHWCRLYYDRWMTLSSLRK